MDYKTDTISATFTEKEIISARFTVVDVVNYYEKYIVNGLIQEVPTKLSAIRFETSLPFVTGTIKFFLNGIKEAKADITEISSTIFEITEAIASDDDFEVEYVKLI
jgi:hypothetical protein